MSATLERRHLVPNRLQCWHQKVRVERAGPDDRYGDVVVDTAKAREQYRDWLRLARPGPGPDGLRRPFWFFRPYRPAPSACKVPGAELS